MSGKALSYKLDKIEIHEFSLYPRPKSATAEKLELNYLLNITSQVVPPQNLIVQQIKIDIELLEPKDPLVTFKILIGYTVEPFNEYVKLNKPEKLYVIDEELEGKLRNISIGTSRGILYTRLQGTYLFDAILPIVHNANIKIGLHPETDKKKT